MQSLHYASRVLHLQISNQDYSPQSQLVTQNIKAHGLVHFFKLSFTWPRLFILRRCYISDSQYIFNFSTAASTSWITRTTWQTDKRQTLKPSIRNKPYSFRTNQTHEGSFKSPPSSQDSIHLRVQKCSNRFSTNLEGAQDIIQGLRTLVTVKGPTLSLT